MSGRADGRARFLALLLALLLAASAVTCRKGPAPPEVKSDAAASPSPSFDAGPFLSRAGVPALAYASVTRDDVVLLGASGKADTAHDAPVTVDTRFEAASIAKTIIATCVMQLAERGKVSLDEDVSKHLGFRVRSPRHDVPITLRLLLTHRASIHDLEPEVEEKRELPLGDFLERYLVEHDKPRQRAFLAAAPATTYEYSNVGASLAAYVVEKVSGRSFDEHTAEALFVPLRMLSASWTTRPSDAVPHTLREGRQVALRDPSHALYPVVDLETNVSELARFARAILRGGELDGARVLSPETVRQMLSPQFGTNDQALGWQVRTFGTARVVGHEGEDRGASTALFLDVEAGTGAVVLANGDAFSGNDPARAAALASLVEELLELARSRSRADRISSTDAH